MKTEPVFAAADWGTTRLRVWLLGAQGEVIAERRSDDGLLSAQPDRFAAILERVLAEMVAPAGLPVIICGMAGARQGWIEAPYATVPTSIGDIFAASVRVPGASRDVRIVPGLAQRGADAPDVMRGEETQLAGAAAKLGPGRHIVCMPGTHSKWVEIVDGAVLAFQTFMTGELFSILSTKSILSHSVGENAIVSADNRAYAKACAAALDEDAAFETRLFRLRAGMLLHNLPPSDAAAGLSGLLIGAEIAAARQRFGLRAGPLVLIASGAMRDLYEAALQLAGFACLTVDADEAVRAGLREAAKHIGLTTGAEMIA